MVRQYNFTNKKFGKRSPWYGILFTIFIAAGLGSGAYFYFNTDLEYQKPIISINQTNSWNQKTPLIVEMNDTGSGIKNYKISYISADEEKTIEENTLSTPQKKLTVNIDPSKLANVSSKVQLIIEATDDSKWNLTGNTTNVSYDLLVDAKSPEVELIAHSYSITQGGGATVVVRIEDVNLKEYFITLNDSLKFKLFPFYKKGYYVAIVPWPITQNEFKGMTVSANDTAGNTTNVKIPLYAKAFKYKTDKIMVSDEFVKTATMKVLELTKSKPINDINQAFLYANQTLRNENIKTLLSLSAKADTTFKPRFEILPFGRLEGSATLANFGDRRLYFKDNQQIDEQWHLGTDWASIQQAPVYTNNSGIVIFNGYLGIYGNTIVIDHGFGIMSLYAHTSSQDVKLGDKVLASQKIANTGASGAVFGDHLHFGILLQGYESDTKEWLDKGWIDARVNEVIENAKRKIDSK